MRKTFIFLLALLAGMFSAPLYAYVEKTTCFNAEIESTDHPNGNNGTTKQKAYITWRTLPATDADKGDTIVLSIHGGAGEAFTVFAAEGQNPLQIDGFWYKKAGSSDAPVRINSYYERVFDANNPTEFRVKPITNASVILKTGDILYYSPKDYDNNRPVFWANSACSHIQANGNVFAYTVGSAPSAQLATPSLTSVSTEGVVTLGGAISGAGDYLVHIYRGETLVGREKISGSGSTLSFRSYVADATYSVKVQAVSYTEGTVSSEWSDAVTWSPAKAALPKSAYCDKYINGNYQYNNPNQTPNAQQKFNITFATEADGKFVITISNAEGNSGTTFHDNGLNNDGFKINGKPITTAFTRQTGIVAGTTTLTYTPNTGDAAPVYGDVITFNAYGEKQSIAWKVGSNNANNPALSFTYIYGTNCSDRTPLDAPIGVSIADNTITFTSVDNAASYKAVVYDGSTLKHEQTVEPAGTVLDYTATGSYMVYVVAVPAFNDEVHGESNRSEGVAWNVIGDSEYCLSSIGSGNSQAYLTWQTADNGDVVITISGSDWTLFRNNGMGSNLNNFKVQKEGQSEEDASTYFNRVYAGDMSRTFTLQLKEGQTLPTGTKIKYNNGTIEWFTANNNNCYGGYTFAYTYGTSCSSALAAPAISGIDGTNHITFNSVTGATAYNLAIYRGANNCVYSQADIHSGDAIGFVPYVDATFSVQVTAVADGYISGISATYDWELTAGTPERNTDICHMTVNEQTDNNVYLTAETDENGRIIFTLEGATWRNDGLTWDKLFVGNQKLQSYFDRESGWAGTNTFILKPKNNQTAVQLGDRIRFLGTAEWNPTSGSNSKLILFSYIYGSKMPTLAAPTISSFADGVITFDPVANAETYTAVIYDANETEYARQTVVSGNPLTRPAVNGTYLVKLIAHASCYHDSPESGAADWVVAAPVLSQPTITDIDADSVITISGDTHATSYVATVSLNGVEKYTQAGLNSGDVLHFFPWVAGDYTVTVVASAEGYSDSEASDAYHWTLTARTVQSKVCSERTGNNNDNYMCLSFVTDASGNIVITMSDYGDNANATFRGNNGMDPLGFKCNGRAMTDYFTRQYGGDKTKTITWLPKTEGDYIPQYGDVITFNKSGEQQQIEWYIGSNGKNGNQYSFEYVYGAICPGLDQPVISNISASKVITFEPVADAENYKLSIYRDGFLVYTQANVSNGATINYDPWVEVNNTVYSVYLTANATGLQSATSEPYEWIMAASREPLTLSEVYNMELSTANGGVYLDIKTDADRRIILTLSGTNNPVWRGSGVQINQMKVYGNQLDSYFDKKKADGTTNYSEGESTMILVPKADCPLKYGDVISYNTAIEWKVSDNNGNVSKNFTYTYGSKPGYKRNDNWMAPGELGTVCYPQGLTFAGANMYVMAGVENGKFVFDEVLDALEPGKPYLFEATSNALMLYVTDDAPVAAPVQNGNMVGTFEEIIIPNTTPDVYYFSGTKFYAVTARQTDLTVPANRAYVDLREGPQPAPAARPGVRRITFGVEGTNTATGIDGIQGNDVPCTKVIMDGKLYILRNGRRYDATGRMVK